MKRLLLIGLACALCAGCTEENPFHDPDSLAPECRRGGEAAEAFGSADELDILVVVDDSGDVVHEQETLAQELPRFLGILEERGLKIRLGVVTTDASAEPGLAPPGTLYEGCAHNTGRFADSERPGDWKRVASCNVVVGDHGQPRQQALEVIERSVVDRPGSLDEFFRERARLLVLVITNEDDCSGGRPLPEDATARDACARGEGGLIEVDAFIDSIRRGAATSKAISLAVFAGPPSGRQIADDEQLRPVCQGTLGAAYPSNRLYRATRAFGGWGQFHSLCTDDLSFGLADAADGLYCSSE